MMADFDLQAPKIRVTSLGTFYNKKVSQNKKQTESNKPSEVENEDWATSQLFVHHMWALDFMYIQLSFKGGHL